MAFKPKSQQNHTGSGDRENTANYPTPRQGARKARVSLIVDLGEQNREDFVDPNTQESKPQKPCQQVAIFADLVADVVDYGGTIGKQQYRLLLNNSFSGEIKGINFTATPPKDAKGNLIEGKQWGLHPANLLTKIAKAVGKPEVVESMDIEALLNMPFMADVEVKETESKNKKDEDGNPTIYKNVNFKGAAKVGTRETDEEDEDGNPIEVAIEVGELKAKPLCITFDDAKPEHIQFIRANLLKMIKNANDYAGSQMEKAVKAFEAAKAGKAAPAGDDDNGDDDAAPAKPEAKQTTPKKTTAPKTTTGKKAPPPALAAGGEEDDAPF